MKSLSDTPDAVREVRDDTEARGLLLELGLLPRLLQLAKKPGLAEPRADVVCHTDHPTHWVFGVYYHGYPLATENGYTVCCLPKSIYTFEQLKEGMRLQLGGDTPIDFYEAWQSEPPRNN